MQETRAASRGDGGRWTIRLALAAALACVPLVLFGGSVTTLGAGMAVQGWLVAEGHFLVVFPVAEWFRDLPTFVEHTHRLFGVLVGLAAVGAVVAAFVEGAPRRVRVWTLAALAGVSAQGTLGGFRVLEASPELAFVHGALAHAVFGLLVLVAFQVRRAPVASGLDREPSPLGRLAPVALSATFVVYAQIVLGAWYRHALRGGISERASEGLVAHVGGALLATALLLLLLGRVALLPPTGSRAVDGAPRRLGLLLGLQLLLGLFAWAGFRPDSVGPVEWGSSILHVLVGALLLAQCLVLSAAALAERRSAARRGALLPLEGAR